MENPRKIIRRSPEVIAGETRVGISRETTERLSEELPKDIPKRIAE